MRKTNITIGGLMIFFSVHANAITIEELAEKNNRLIELDQDIAIAEKNKKLMEIKSSSNQSDTIALPRVARPKQEESMQVLAVHGVPGNPIVDVQYGNSLLQKKIGESLPDGWEIAAVANTSVTFSKKIANKPSLVKVLGIGIGHDNVMRQQIDSSLNNSITAPSHLPTGN